MSSNRGIIYLVRGLPGAGKSTFACKLANALDVVGESFGSVRIFENDTFFVDEITGEYRFDRDLCPTAANWTIARVCKFCRDFPVSPVIVANTFTTNAEMHPYYNVADYFNRDVVEIDIRTDHKSIHNVPDEVIERMKDRWEYGNPTNHYTVYEDSEVDEVCEKISKDFKKNHRGVQVK